MPYLHYGNAPSSLFCCLPLVIMTYHLNPSSMTFEYDLKVCYDEMLFVALCGGLREGTAICALPMQADDDDGEAPATRKEKLAMWRARRLAAKAAEEEAEERERQVPCTSHITTAERSPKAEAMQEPTNARHLDTCHMWRDNTKAPPE